MALLSDKELAANMQHTKYIQFQTVDVGLILTQLYKDEARFSFGWMFDSGFSYFILNDYINGVESVHQQLKYAEHLRVLPKRLIKFFNAYYNNKDYWWKIEDAFSVIAYSFAVLYPHSTFS